MSKFMNIFKDKNNQFIVFMIFMFFCNFAYVDILISRGNFIFNNFNENKNIVFLFVLSCMIFFTSTSVMLSKYDYLKYVKIFVFGYFLVNIVLVSSWVLYDSCPSLYGNTISSFLVYYKYKYNPLAWGSYYISSYTLFFMLFMPVLSVVFMFFNQRHNFKTKEYSPTILFSFFIYMSIIGGVYKVDFKYNFNIVDADMTFFKFILFVFLPFVLLFVVMICILLYKKYKYNLNMRNDIKRTFVILFISFFVVFIVFQFVHIYINHTNIFSVWFTQGHSNVRSIGKCFIISEGGNNG